MEQSEDTLPVC